MTHIHIFIYPKSCACVHNLSPATSPVLAAPSLTCMRVLSQVALNTCSQSIGRVDAPRCRLLVHDTKLLLLRFALGESFSTYSKGGGRESNIKLLPYFVQMATFLLDSPAQPQRAMYKRILATWIAQEPTRHGPDSVLYMLVLSLLLHSPEEWATLRLLFLRRLLQYSRAEGRDRYSLMLPVSPTASPAIRGRSPGSGRSPALVSSPRPRASSEPVGLD